MVDPEFAFPEYKYETTDDHLAFVKAVLDLQQVRNNDPGLYAMTCQPVADMPLRIFESVPGTGTGIGVLSYDHSDHHEVMTTFYTKEETLIYDELAYNLQKFVRSTTFFFNENRGCSNPVVNPKLHRGISLVPIRPTDNRLPANISPNFIVSQEQERGRGRDLHLANMLVGVSRSRSPQKRTSPVEEEEDYRPSIAYTLPLHTQDPPPYARSPSFQKLSASSGYGHISSLQNPLSQPQSPPDSHKSSSAFTDPDNLIFLVIFVFALFFYIIVQYV